MGNLGQDSLYTMIMKVINSYTSKCSIFTQVDWVRAFMMLFTAVQCSPVYFQKHLHLHMHNYRT